MVAWRHPLGQEEEFRMGEEEIGLIEGISISSHVSWSKSTHLGTQMEAGKHPGEPWLGLAQPALQRRMRT